MSEPVAVYCEDLRREGLVPDGVVCCSSCHHEFDEGLITELGGTLKDGREAYVCCTVAAYLRERGLL